MSGRVRPAVKALIQKEEKILVLETEAGEETYWVLPGGKVEYGEHPMQTLEREIEEELSVNTSIGEAIGMYHFFIGSEEEGDEIVLTVFQTEIEGEIDIENNPAEEGIVEYHWLMPEE